MMRSKRSLLVFLLPILALFLFGVKYFHTKRLHGPEKEDSPVPNDYFFLQRAFPYDNVPSEPYYAARRWAQQHSAGRSNDMKWEPAGPTNIGGRISDVTMHASDLKVIYAASASGGVWRSIDAGGTWVPVSDDLPALSIGDIAIDPSDKNVIYCGTGETNGGGGSVTYDGLGVFKSDDGGDTWTPLGLERTGSIGRIEVDPKNPERIYVATMGRLFANNPERGLYRSDDGGATWQRKLFVNDSTGVIDLVVHPHHPDTIFAVSWERVRRPNLRRYGGPGCAIWRSFNGGDTWTKLGGGLPSANIGRIGIAMAGSNPDVLYAIYADITGYFLGTYRSNNGGNTWNEVNFGSDPDYASYGWWFGQIRVDPTDPNRVYTLGIDWRMSVDGGNSWSEVSLSYLHADYHALYIHPADPKFKVAGNDGGIFIDANGTGAWKHKPFPITQFYTSEIDFQNPARIYGGAQDNGTLRTLTGNIDDWKEIYGGDGFVTLVHPNNSNHWYAEYQYGNLYGTNGARAPQSARYNWNSPYIFDPHDPAIMYFGAERLFRSINGGRNWNAISPDLTDGNSGSGGVVYGTITTIAASPLDAGTLIAGTDDGNVWFTSSGGADWTRVSTALPKRWITRVVADLWDKNTAYVCLSGFRHFEDIAHIYKTTNGGQTWVNVSGDLPDIPVNDLILDPDDPYTWYIATDVGVFTTYNSGVTWEPPGAGLPNVPVLDLTFHAPSRTMVAATYGRSMYKATLSQPTGVASTPVIGNVVIAPNPFIDRATVSFYLRESGNIRAEIADFSGKTIKTIFNGVLSSGEHRFGLSGTGLVPGIYIVKIDVERGVGYNGRIVKME